MITLVESMKQGTGGHAQCKAWPEKVKDTDYMHGPMIPLDTHKFQYKYDAM